MDQRYIIYGINRVAKDFLYIFDDLNVICFAEDSADSKEFMGYQVKEIEDAVKQRDYDKIIICDFDKSSRADRLNSLGLCYMEDYIYEEDLFDSLDDFEITKEKSIAVWGTGNMAEYFNEQNKNIKVEFYIDSFKGEKNSFNGKPVYLPEEVDHWEDLYIIIAVNKNLEIKNRLSEMGLKENENFVYYQKAINAPSHLIRKTIFDKSYYDLECNTMLNHMEILDGGMISCCCTTFIKERLESILEKPAAEVWNSKLHKILCLSAVNKTYTFCDKNMCPLFIGRKCTQNVCTEDTYKEMEKSPSVLGLGMDSTCNLACETCRKEIYVAQGIEKEIAEKIAGIVNKQLLKNCKFLILAGNGEVFASKAYRSVYESEQCRETEYIRILSNGILFTEKKWEEFSKNKSAKIMLTVSIDAATKETYEIIRRNGNFDKLRENMEFASKLRQTGQLSYFRMNFVVQRKNYKEMIPFVTWADSLHADEVFFTKILNWGTYTRQEFSEISMMEEDGIAPKKELKAELQNPIFQSPLVDLGTIQYLHKPVTIDLVENYYMWELQRRGNKLFG